VSALTAPPGSGAPRVVLASGSPYRAELLRRLCDSFVVRPGRVDETPAPAENCAALAARLAGAKADGAVAGNRGRAMRELIIGSDQVAELDGEALGKPGSVAANIDMLGRCSGRAVIFHTAACLLDTGNGLLQAHVDTTEVRFRTLSRHDIQAYVERDRALDCAGGFKLERAGIYLFNSVINEDPTAIIGLPMIWLAGALRRVGWRLSHAAH
jgi:septum formation protein